MNTPFYVGIGFGLFCGWLLIDSFFNYKKAQASIGWPSVNGDLLKVRLWGKRNVGGTMQEVENLRVSYSYDVRGISHTGSTVAFYTLVYPETVDFAQDHPVNSEVAVYYQPDNPSESVLIPGPKPGSKRYSDLLLAGIGVLISAGIAIAGALGIIG